MGEANSHCYSARELVLPMLAQRRVIFFRAKRVSIDSMRIEFLVAITALAQKALSQAASW